jgi:hypothetical protein
MSEPKLVRLPWLVLRFIANKSRCWSLDAAPLVAAAAARSRASLSLAMHWSIGMPKTSPLPAGLSVKNRNNQISGPLLAHGRLFLPRVCARRFELKTQKYNSHMARRLPSARYESTLFINSNGLAYS